MSLNSEMKAHMDVVRKVTGVSGLLNLASSTDSLNDLNLFKFKTVGGKLPADGTSHVAIEAPDIDGYTFVFWLNSASIGAVNSSYVETPTDKSTNIWATGSNNEWFQSTAVYVKSGFVDATGGAVNASLKYLSDLMCYYLLLNRKEV